MELNDRYIIKSNRESGLGRFDITLEPRKTGTPTIIIEFKVHRPQLEDSLRQTAQNALEQIKNKNYAAELISHGVNPNNIYSYGIAFKGKEALVITE